MGLRWLVWMKNVPHRLRYLNTWPPISNPVCKGGMVLLEKKHHWGMLWELISNSTSSSCSPFPVCVWMWSLNFLFQQLAVMPPLPSQTFLLELGYHQEKEARLCHSNYMTFLKRQNYEDRKKISGCQGWEFTEDIVGPVQLFCMRAPRCTPRWVWGLIKHGLWVTRMHHTDSSVIKHMCYAVQECLRLGRPLSSSMPANVVSEADHCPRMWELSLQLAPSSQFSPLLRSSLWLLETMLVPIESLECIG